MSFGSIGSKANQASAASQQLSSPTNQSQYVHSNSTNEPIVNHQHVHHFSETAFEQHEESSEDTVVEFTDGERNTMGNRQCTGKEQGSRSEDKEEDGDIWVKRDEEKNSNISTKKREDKKRKKKQKYKDKTLNQNNGPGTTKEDLKQTGNGNGQDQCGSKGQAVVEVKEIDRWAEVKMADEYSSSSTGYQTPETRTPKQKRKVSQQEMKNNAKNNISKSETTDVIKPAFSKGTKTEFNKNESVTSQPKTNTDIHIVPFKKEQKISQFSPNYASISKPEKTTKPIQQPKESISKTEALAKLDSLTNSPRSQRRHALLLSSEVAKYIPLPPEKGIPSTMTIEESPVVYSKIKRDAVSKATSKMAAKHSPKLPQHSTPKIPPRRQSETIDQSDEKPIISTNNSQGEANDVRFVAISPNDNLKTEMRASTIEVMEDNRANELREGAPTETFETAPGPGVAVLACIPPPEKALISQVPPPSPSSIAIFEEDEEADGEIDESDNRKSREMEVFNDNVCQRLSLLLETKELMEDKIDESADSVDDMENILQGQRLIEAKEDVIDKFDESSDSDVYVDDILFSGKGDGSSSSNIDSSDDEYDENDYVQGSDSFDYSDDEVDGSCDFGMDIPVKTKSIPEIKLSIARTPGGKNDATPLDMMNNNFKLHEMKQESIPECSKFNEPNTTHESSHKCSSNQASDELPEYNSRYFDEATGYSEFHEKGQKSETNKTTKSPVTKNKHARSVPTSEVQCGWDLERHDSDLVFLDDVELKEGDSLDSSNSPKRSRLDESIKALFKGPKLEQHSENEPAQFLPDLDFDITPSSDRTAIIEDKIIPDDAVGIQASARRRSIGYTESSDLDVSEQRDDLSTDSMLADDEDEGEVLFSRTYPEPSGAEVLVSCTVVNSGAHSVDDDKFWDDEDLDDDFDLDDDDDEHYLGDEPYSQDPFASDAYVDINDSDFDNARKQMQDIHEHLKNLKHQMNNLQDDIGGASCVPDPHGDDDFDPVGKRRAMTD